MSTALQRRRPRDTELPMFSPSADITTFSLSTTTIPHPQRKLRRRKKFSHSHSRTGFNAPPTIAVVLSCILSFSILWLGVRWLAGPFLFGPTEIALPVANVDILVPNATEWPLLHIVNTRFMQEQGYLPTLGMARLHLFETFCLPTMVGQSTQDFLWIIKTDPQLDTSVLDRLLNLVRPYSNIYVVASNRNFLISPDLVGSWRDGAEGRDLLTSKIYSGNLTRLNQAIALRNERPVLETRLDADDGLHQEFLKYIQLVAMHRFLQGGNDGPASQDGEDESRGHGESTETPKWLYWCSRRHIEWRPGTMNQSSTSVVGDFPFGVLNPVEHSKLCITPGITVGYNTGTLSSDVPCEAHDLLYKHIVTSTSCYDGANPTRLAKKEGEPLCLELVEDLTFAAIRSRTWTSAGMQKVDSPDVHVPSQVQKEMTQKLWHFLEGRFHMTQYDALETQHFLYEHQAQIAYENLLGQCTSFHSCKQQAKDSLEAYMKGASENGIKVIKRPADASYRFRMLS
jgi:Putative rhamnosyl transferase